MWTDPIVEELHKIREYHAARFDYDIYKIFDDLKSKEESLNINFVELPTVRNKEIRIVSEKSQEYK